MRACHLDWQQKEERTSMHHLVMAPTLSLSMAGVLIEFTPLHNYGPHSLSAIGRGVYCLLFSLAGVSILLIGRGAYSSHWQGWLLNIHPYTSMHLLVMAPTLSPSLAMIGVSILPIGEMLILNIHPCKCNGSLYESVSP